MFDPVCVAAAIDESIITESVELDALVDLWGKLTKGSLVADWKNLDKKSSTSDSKKKIRFVLGVDRKKFVEMMIYSAKATDKVDLAHEKKLDHHQN